MKPRVHHDPELGTMTLTIRGINFTMMADDFTSKMEQSKMNRIVIPLVEKVDAEQVMDILLFHGIRTVEAKATQARI